MVSQRVAGGGPAARFEANEVFGAYGWSQEIAELHCVFAREGGDRVPARAAYLCRARVTASSPDPLGGGSATVVREEIGFGDVAGAEVAECHARAAREAVGEAVSRCLESFDGSLRSGPGELAADLAGYRRLGATTAQVRRVVRACEAANVAVEIPLARAFQIGMRDPEGIAAQVEAWYPPIGPEPFPSGPKTPVQAFGIQPARWPLASAFEAEGTARQKAKAGVTAHERGLSSEECSLARRAVAKELGLTAEERDSKAGYMLWIDFLARCSPAQLELAAGRAGAVSRPSGEAA